MRKLLSLFSRKLFSLVLLSILGALLSATMLRLTPGHDVDQRELDSRLSQSSIEAIRSEHARNSSLIHFFKNYLVGAVHGDFGTSESLQQPVFALVKERLPVTAKSIALGLFAAWLLAFALATASLAHRGWVIGAPSTLLSGILLGLPSGVIALFSVYLRAPVFVAIAAVSFPRLFRYTRNLLVDARNQPHVLAARARGVGSLQIFFRHVLPPAAPGLVALLGVSVSIAFGAALPIEALCDSAGVGQLAWNAALNRDMPLLTSLTLVVTLITIACNSFAADAANLFKRAA